MVRVREIHRGTEAELVAPTRGIDLRDEVMESLLHRRRSRCRTGDASDDREGRQPLLRYDVPRDVGVQPTGECAVAGNRSRDDGVTCPPSRLQRWLSGSGVYICCAMASSVVRQRCAADSWPEHGRAERTSRPQSGAELRESETRKPVRVLAVGTLLLRQPDVERIVLATSPAFPARPAHVPGLGVSAMQHPQRRAERSHRRHCAATPLAATVRANDSCRKRCA